MSKELSTDWLSLVYHGQLVTRQWLLSQGATEHALDNAVKSKRLKVLTRGVLARYEVPITWQGVAASLNRIDGPVYVGGISALAEQAIFEVLVAVPNTFSFEYADSLMQGMINLSPRRLDAVLRACNHIRAKRLFFFFADRYEYSWRKKIQPENYDLGSGKRSIIVGGRLDKKYNITVPEEFYG